MTGGLVVPYGALGAALSLPAAVQVPVSAQMIVLATLVIYIASYHAAHRERRRVQDGDSAEPRDVITGAQAWRFPIVASVSLFSMFLAFKYLPKAWVSLALTLYGVLFGGFALANTLARAIDLTPGMPDSMRKEFGHKDYVLMTGVDVLSLFAAAPVAYWYFKERSWLANNILAVSLGLSAIDLLAIGEFKASVVLLCGLFVYDAFWVFGSKSIVKENVMVAVAKNFEGPIKLVFPRFPGAATAGDFSLLGLGDIVIPGLFIALMLRFDIRNTPLNAVLPKRLPYFFGSMVAYVAGLVATIAAMNIFEAAQPALIYLVPACLLTAFGTAAAKGEFGELWAYSEEDESEEEKKAKKDEKTDSPVSKGDAAVGATDDSKKDQ